MPDSSVQRHMLLQAGNHLPKGWHGRRRRGRPRQEWAQSVFDHVVRVAGTAAEVAALIANAGHWRQAVLTYCDKVA